MNDKIVGIDMISAAGLFLGLSTLLVSGTAEACSYSYEVFSGKDNYWVYHSHVISALEYSDTKFALVKTRRGQEVDKNPYKLLDGEDDSLNNKLFQVEFDEIEVLKGDKFPSSLNFPELLEEDLIEINQRKTRELDFDFWDTAPLGHAASSWYGAITSCGFYGHSIVIPGEYFLIGIYSTEQMGSDDPAILVEPVNGPEDDLVIAMRAIIENTKDNPLSVTPEYFFSHMNGYQIFDVKSCPFGEEEFNWNKGRDLLPDDYEQFNDMFGVVESVGSNYTIKPQNFIFTQKCKIGDRYLVIERPARKASYEKEEWPIMSLPVHRFLKVENNKIILDDEFPTNYEFTGETIIPVELVKTWIRAGVE